MNDDNTDNDAGMVWYGMVWYGMVWAWKLKNHK